ncbi:SDR family oxidoreductase [Chitinophaga nivalis]|uniref:SDR family oxidoreductase n=1 Tax=Chitinophaga nivalis TaxID=2991709 RepID=A0ABT3II92_9BACT|nr:SDR family oxidoreductase [Chitinophaga nivalis]MCW3466789.1 SDR family oxidoreductase [Chitinophaga nivalis]MCW3483520.1 SDR family oxidoreductase [Chitinophaga nivalis]
MKILLTGAGGYIAQRLLPVLLENGHEVICCVRDSCRFDANKYPSYPLQVITVDFMDPASLRHIPADIDAAYYLVHPGPAAASEVAITAARHFRTRLEQTRVQHVICLSDTASDIHLIPSVAPPGVDAILAEAAFPTTILKADIIIGAGSATFHILYDWVRKSPVISGAQWLHNTCQPIALRDVIHYLLHTLSLPPVSHRQLEITGPDTFTWRQILQRLAVICQVNCPIFPLPAAWPQLAALKLAVLTAPALPHTQHLIKKMWADTVLPRTNSLATLLPLQQLSFDTAVHHALQEIFRDEVLSSWRDTKSGYTPEKGIMHYQQVPVTGCYKDIRKKRVNAPTQALKKIWEIGGSHGWYYANWLWSIRGLLDKLAGGAGKQRGRTSSTRLATGQALDFWRVVTADKANKKLLLYAEMKVPGEAWLSFEIIDQELIQTATFKPHGITGKLYWYAMLPFHAFIFPGMIRYITSEN